MADRIQPGDLLTVPEVADLLRCKPSTVRAWLTKSKIPRVKVGRLTRIMRSDVEGFIRAGRTVGNEQ